MGEDQHHHGPSKFHHSTMMISLKKCLVTSVSGTLSLESVKLTFHLLFFVKTKD